MGKKRRVRWIVGSFVLLMLAFVVALTVATNTPDARMGRVLAEVIDEYGFEKTLEFSTGSSDDGGSVTKSIYSVELHDEELEGRLVARLSEACEGCRVEHVELHPRAAAKMPTIDAGPWVLIEPGDDYASLASIVVTVSGRGTADGGGFEPQLLLMVDRRDRAQGFLDKLRGWLPW